MAQAKVVCFINYKGGVGKTTTTYHIGCSLAGHHKKRVLLIDIDPQTNLTFLCAPVEKWEDFKRKTGTVATLYQRYQDHIALDTKRYIWRSPMQILGGKYRIDGLDLIPCDIDLIGEDLGGGQLVGTLPSLESLKKNSQAFLRVGGVEVQSNRQARLASAGTVLGQRTWLRAWAAPARPSGAPARPVLSAACAD